MLNRMQQKRKATLSVPNEEPAMLSMLYTAGRDIEATTQSSPPSRKKSRSLQPETNTPKVMNWMERCIVTGIDLNGFEKMCKDDAHISTFSKESFHSFCEYIAKMAIEKYYNDEDENPPRVIISKKEFEEWFKTAKRFENNRLSAMKSRERKKNILQDAAGEICKLGDQMKQVTEALERVERGLADVSTQMINFSIKIDAVESELCGHHSILFTCKCVCENEKSS